MSVERQFNAKGQGRFDVQHLRAIESSIANDFDVLAGRILAGNLSFVVNGFDVLVAGLNGPASSLLMNTATGTLVHPLASEAGTIFTVPADRGVESLSSSNARVVGSFTTSTINYISIDLVRSPDTTTEDVVQFWDPAAVAEKPLTVPLGRTLDYVIYISTSDFSATPGRCPVAKITTNGSNTVTAIEDARNLLFRLGSGGSVPNAANAYGWPGTRAENTTGEVFAGGDKAILSFKDWMDAVMTRLWDLGGGQYWYGVTADRNVQMSRGGTKFSNGEWFEWDGTNLHWRGLKFIFDNSGITTYYNTITDQTIDAAGAYGTTATDLADGDCIYVDLSRSSNATIVGVKAKYSTLGAPAVPGSRQVIAWRIGTTVYTRGSSFPVGVTFTVATTTALGIVKLNNAPADPSNPFVPARDANGSFVATATAGNVAAWIGTGNGSGSGIKGTGGPASGVGVEGHGGATDGIGVQGQGTGSGFGVRGIAGTGGSSPGVSGLGDGPGAGVEGTGGASGPGVRGLGTGIGSGLEGTGGATGSALVLHGVVSNTNPIFKAKDSSGNLKGGTDYLGYPMNARATILDEPWVGFAALVGVNIGVAFANIGRWIGYGTTHSDQRIGITGPDTTFNSSGAQIRFLAAVGGGEYSVISSSSAVYIPQAPTSFVAEWEMCLSQVAADNTTWAVGFFDNNTGLSPPVANGGATTGHGAFFMKASADTTWIAASEGGANITRVDTTIVPVANTMNRCRLEIHGASSIIGAATCYFYVDGVLRGTTTTNQPTVGSALQFQIFAFSTGVPVAGSLLFVGPVRCCWNRYASPTGL